MIDDVDIKIIIALKKNARVSNVRLAHQLNMAVSTVSRRIDTLFRGNIISVKALPNPYKMGYKSCAVIGLDVDLRKVDDICSKLKDNSHITLVVTTFGRFDVLIIVDYPDFELLNNFLKQELPQIEGIIRAEPFLVSETTKRYSGMFQKNELPSANNTINEIDRRLVAELGKNGRIAYSKLAFDLGISVATVSRRVASLVKENIIKITIVPNPAKFGYQSIGVVFLHTEYAQIGKIASILAARPEVNVVLKFTNGYDIFFIVDFSSHEQLYYYLKEKIARIDGVLKIETFVVSEIVKLSTTSTGLKI